MALGSLQLNPDLHPIPLYIQEKHFNRKHEGRMHITVRNNISHSLDSKGYL